MKIHFSNVTLCLLLVVALSANGQDYAFKVLVNKGNNEVKTGNTWQPLKTGATLKKEDEVKLVDNAYLGLIHASGKPLELKQAGKYKVVDLAGKVGAGASVLNKYTDFILSSNTDKKNRLAATGAVHRGVQMTTVYLPKSELAVVYGNKVTMNWHRPSQDATTPYLINLKSIFGDDLYIGETMDTTFTLDLSDAKYVNEDNIIVEVYPKGSPDKKPNPAYIVKKLSKADKDRVKIQLNEIASLTGEENALNKRILAGFFEQNKLLIDAGTAYLEAIKLAPEVDEYKEAYNNFLLRNGLKEEKKK